MRTLVIGGGRVGSYLTRALRDAGHGVIVIESKPARAKDLAEQTSALVVAGDGTDVRLLEGVGADRADMVLATTGLDDVNLVACQLARTAFGCRKVLARLNDPENRPTFEALDVPVVSVTDLIVQVIRRELALEDLIRVDLIGNGEVSVVEVEIPESVASRDVRDLHLPPSSVLVAVRRDGSIMVPGAATELRPGDRVMAVTLIDAEEELAAILVGRKSGSDSGRER